MRKLKLREKMTKGRSDLWGLGLLSSNAKLLKKRIKRGKRPSS